MTEPSVPQAVDHVARAAQATHMAIMALAASQDRLEGLRTDRKASPADVSDAAQRYRQAEALVKRCVDQEVAAQREMLNDLTLPDPSIKINIVSNQPEGAHDAQSNP